MTSEPTDNLRDSISYAQKRYGVSDAAARFRRRRGPDKVIEPGEKDWQVYREAIEALKRADANPFIHVGSAVDEPEAYSAPGEYLETEREWITRIVEMLEASGGRIPDDLGMALSVGEYRVLAAVFGEHARGQR